MYTIENDLESDIDFTYNWNNKLACNIFTTMRLYNPNKYQVGNIYNIRLKGKTLARAIIVEIKNFKMDDINAFVAMLDTGYSVEECKRIFQRMYPRVDFTRQLISLILLKKIENKLAFAS